MKVKSVTVLHGQRICYDLTIKDNHNYYANGVLVHNCQNIPRIFEVLHGVMCVVTIKYDGHSGTFFRRNEETGVCSRNLLLKEPTDENSLSSYWKVERKYDILNKLKALDYNLQLSGEVYGEGIQKNRLGISGIDLALFTAFNIDTQQYMGHDELVGISKQLEIPMVKVVTDILVIDKNVHTLEYFLNKVEEYTYDNGHPVEGMVIRPIKEMFDPKLGRLSFKVISNKFLLATGE